MIIGRLENRPIESAVDVGFELVRCERLTRGIYASAATVLTPRQKRRRVTQ